jgi:putative protease
MNVEEFCYDLQLVSEVVKGQVFSMPVVDKVRRNDKLYKLVDGTKLKQ